MQSYHQKVARLAPRDPLNIPAGPVTVHELFDYPNQHIRSIMRLPGRLKLFESNFKGYKHVLKTQYSGMLSAEIVLQNLEKAMGNQGLLPAGAPSNGAWTPRGPH